MFLNCFRLYALSRHSVCSDSCLDLKIYGQGHVRGGDNTGHTIHDGNDGCSMGYTIHNILRSTKDHSTILHSTMDHTIRYRPILHNTMGHSTKGRNICCRSSSYGSICSNMNYIPMNSNMGYIPMNYSMDCNVCSNTMNYLSYMGRSNIHSCFPGPISSRMDSHPLSLPCRRLSGHIVFWQTCFPGWR